VILVNRETGRVINTLNYENGLPDDEVYAIAADNFQGLWITYRFGICRLDLKLPVRDYSSYPGLEGLYTGVVFHKDKLYVSTTTGFYGLSEVRNYEEIDLYIKRDPPPEPQKSMMQEAAEEPDVLLSTEQDGEVVEPPEEEKKRGFFARLFRRKAKEVEAVAEENGAGEIPEESEVVAEPEPALTPEPKPPIKPQPQYVKKTISRLKSIEHVFKKTEGIPGNCQHLVSTDQGILAGTSSGLYIVNNDRAELITDTRNINFIGKGTSEESYMVAGENEIVQVSSSEEGWLAEKRPLPYREPISSVCKTDSSTIWATGLGVVYRLSDTVTEVSQVQMYQFESVYPEELSLAFINDTLFLFSESMVQYYLPAADSFLHYSAPPVEPEKFSSIHLFPSANGDHWVRIDNMILPFSAKARRDAFGYEIFSLFNNISSFYPQGEDIFWMIDEFSGIYRIDLSEQSLQKESFKIFTEQITNEKGDYYSLDSPVFDPSEKRVTLRLTAPYYLKDNSTQFQYLMEDRMDQWSEWTSESAIQIITGPGVYQVKVRARNVLGVVSDPAMISFSIQTPFYQTPLFYVILIPFFFGILFLFIYAREQKLRHDKLLLEQKIDERTREIQLQKEQIEHQKNEILTQKNDITSSINYASKIQNAVLPDKKLFDAAFEEYFIFYKPRDIVSGDFYWITRKGRKTIFAVADSTGHGVPGAFMSMLGNSFLNEIIKSDSVSLSPNLILNQLRDKISEALAQSGEKSSTHDGMDIALCIYDRTKSEIEFSGAYNSMYIVRNGELITVRGDMMPIGYYPKKRNFTSKSVKVVKGDILYLFTDGFPDQFGGSANKKYTIGKFKKLLVDISNQPMEEQHLILQTTLKKWQGENVRVDDVLVLGVKL
jgi:serine phosphatase RsbU (regulator of sigma subunit)